MTYDFFADKTDKIEILDYIFKNTDLKVYDLGSKNGQEIEEYLSIEDIVSKFDLVNGNKFALTFQLWTPRLKGKINFRKIELDPRKCNGHTFRYSTDGWGLIQLYFGGIYNNELNQSHIGHFEEKEALKNEKTNSFNGKVSDWDWKEVQNTSNNLKSYIQKNLVIRKQDSFDILNSVDKLLNQGIKLR